MSKGSLSVVGTGFFVAGHITPEARDRIESADRLFHLVGEPATRAWLEEANPAAESLYDAYAEGKPRRDSYAEMTERILAPLADGGDVCAAFYGHPGVFVAPSHAAVRAARAAGHEATMLPGVSAEDCLFADLGLDPAVPGCQSFEATDFLVRRRRLDPAAHLVLWQIGAIGVDSYQASSDAWGVEGLRLLVETLLETYRPDHPVTVYEAATLPVCRPLVRTLPLAELATGGASLMSTLYVPPRDVPATDAAALARLDMPAPAVWTELPRPPLDGPPRSGAGEPGRLTVVGTGYAVAGQVTPQTLSHLETADRLLYLANDPATGAWLRGLNPGAESLHDSYRVGEDGLAASTEMTERILAPVRAGVTVCAAFQGHPAVYLLPSHEALRQARAEGRRAEMLPAISIEDCLFAELGFDPAIGGRLLYEATDFVARPRRFETSSHLLLLQAGAVGVARFREGLEPERQGLRLLARQLERTYPGEHEVVLYERSQLPFAASRLDRLPLARLAEARISLITTLYLPPLPSPAPDPAMLRRLGIERRR